ncbi:MAG: TatD family hydrolase [Bacteroidota bacterium]
MMRVIDTHAHLYSEKFNHDQDAVIERAKKYLKAVFLPNVDLETIEPMWALTEKSPDFFFPMIGLHPTHVEGNYEKQLVAIEKELRDESKKYVGIGETGLDLYWDKSTLTRQQASLEVHLNWAKETELPIILHARDAIDEVTDMIEEHYEDGLTGIIHCFDGDSEQAARICELDGFKVGIGGIVTYRKDVQQMVREIPLEWIVLETDSPYLPPIPHRKDKPRRNESSYTHYVAEKVAELKNLPLDEVAEVTNMNAENLFYEAEVLEA